MGGNDRDTGNRERFLNTNKPGEGQTRKTKVKPEKAGTGPRGECGQGRGCCQSGGARTLAPVALR